MRLIAAAIVCAAVGWLIWAYVMPHAPPKRLAPDGTFFLRERVSKQTSSGVYALLPGTEVHRVSENGSRLIVSDGHETFDLTPAQLTNDLDVAEEFANSDRENARRVQATLEQEKRSLANKKKAEYVENARRMEEHDRARRSATGKPNPLEKGPYNQAYSVPYWYPYGYPNGVPIQYDGSGRRYWVDQWGGWHYIP